ncbi:ATP-binding protein [Clostridium sporogenes]|uniref:ATP-binding protein n=1 Tax=Clostridium sporogenes TaxID=1509 RepID=A0AAE6I694_CLOSG|nr:ATP-binding protein [Clostridium sporogenes]QDY32708.1 ATP-binding protein [Clostridium sporogenes]
MKTNNLSIKEFNLTFSPFTITDALGSKAIELDSIVIAELIKNSKDANAKNITVDLSNYQNTIIIKDDGDGMNSEDIANKWGVVASNNKINNGLLGGKGIGRFSLFKLCNRFTIITRKVDSSELEFTIDRNVLMSYSKAEDFKTEIYTNEEPKIFKNNLTGTKIILEDMNKISIDEIYSGLKNLILENSYTYKGINISYIYPENFKTKTTISPNKAKLSAPFHCVATFKKNKILNYYFSVELNNVNLVKVVNPEDFMDKFNKTIPNIDLGEIKFEINVFFFGNNFIKNYQIDKKTIQDQFLDFYYGISVYRNDFKIYGLGKYDWLELTEERVDAPSKTVNNKQIYGYVELKSPDSDNLEEKTSREGFIRSDYLDYLKCALKLIIKQFNKNSQPYRKSLNAKNSLDLFKDNTIKETPSGISTIQNDGKNEEEPSDISTMQNDGKNEEKPSDIPTIQNDGKPEETPSDISTIQNDGKPEKTPSDIPTMQNDGKPEEMPSDISAIQNDGKPEETPSTNATMQIPKKTFNPNTIIDPSYSLPTHTPEKIKRIVYELQKIKQEYVNAQALLLRCLIDISTKYISDALTIEISENDLRGSILKVLNNLSNDKLLNSKYIDRIRVSLKKGASINYFNGVAHEYDYRPNYTKLKETWNIFEPYITFCTKQKIDK